jgi:HK97 gp10 family phage protein
MDIRFKVDSKEAQQAFEIAPDVMERNLERFLSRGAQEVARAAKSFAPKAFSTLTNSILASRVGPLHWRVSPGANYAPYVEGGTRPHFPPPVNLQPWVERVLGLSGEEARHRAFLIARAISRRGTRAQPYMRPAAEQMRSRVFALLNEGVDAGLREVFAK